MNTNKEKAKANAYGFNTLRSFAFIRVYLSVFVANFIALLPDQRPKIEVSFTGI